MTADGGSVGIKDISILETIKEGRTMYAAEPTLLETARGQNCRAVKRQSRTWRSSVPTPTA